MNITHRFRVTDLDDGGTYDIVFTRRGTNVTLTCSCGNAQRGLFCNHRLGAISGNDEYLEILEGDEGVLLTGLVELCHGSDVADALRTVISAIHARTAANSAYETAVQVLADRMAD